MLRKTILLAIFYFVSALSLIIFNHIILSKILIFLLLALCSIKTLQSAYILPTLLVYFFVLFYFIYLYWQLALSNMVFNLGIYSYIIFKQMFVHFCNTAKAYLISLRLTSNIQLINIFFILITFYLFVCLCIVI